MPPAAGHPGGSGADAARDVALILRVAAAEDLAHLEQRGILEAAVRVGARG